jgi:hypothetical protein
MADASMPGSRATTPGTRGTDIHETGAFPKPKRSKFEENALKKARDMQVSPERASEASERQQGGKTVSFSAEAGAGEASAKTELCPSAAEAAERGGCRGATPRSAKKGLVPRGGCRGATPQTPSPA